MRACLIILIISICINGCASVKTDSVVWRAEDVSISDYRSLLVLEIFNASGKPVSKESLAYCTEQFKKQLASHDLEIVEQRPESGNPLLVQTSIVYFEFERAVIGSNVNTSTAKESLVSVHVVMRDQALNRTVAEIKNVNSFASMGVFNLGDRKHNLFRRVAEITANDIEKLLRPAKPQ